LLTPTIFFNLVLSVISTFQTFTSAFVATDGGPLDSTLFYVLYLFRQAFQFFNMGYASALAWILFLLILGLTLVIVRSADRWVYYEGGRQ
jgi:multiple sugar transport system permease protein